MSARHGRFGMFPAVNAIGMRGYGAAIDAEFREMREARMRRAFQRQNGLQDLRVGSSEDTEGNAPLEMIPPNSPTHFQSGDADAGMEHEWDQRSENVMSTTHDRNMSFHERVLYYSMYVLHFGISHEEIQRMEQLMTVLYRKAPPISYDVHVASLNKNILNDYNRQRYFFCCSCNEEMSELQSSCNNGACTIHGLNIKRAKRMQRIEIHVISMMPQLTDILVRDIRQIIDMHERLHGQGGNSNDRSDIRCFEGYYTSIETPDAFREKRLKVLLSLSLDGFRPRRISKREMWPLYLRIDSLSPKEANKYFNSIIAGTIYSRVKPTEKMLETLFSRLETELHDLRDYPIEIDVDGTLWTIEVELYRGIADMAAQQVLFGTPRWNSEYGCSKCYIQGTRIDNHRVWIAGNDNDTILRSRDSYLIDGRAQEYGITKVTAAMRLMPPCDFVGDALHVCSEGITRDRLRDLFDPSSKFPELRVDRGDVERVKQCLLGISSHTYSNSLILSLEDLPTCKGRRDIGMWIIVSVVVSTV